MFVLNKHFEVEVDTYITGGSTQTNMKIEYLNNYIYDLIII